MDTAISYKYNCFNYYCFMYAKIATIRAAIESRFDINIGVQKRRSSERLNLEYEYADWVSQIR